MRADPRTVQERLTPGWRWLAAVATGALFDLVLGVEPWWPATWVAPIPLLVAALSTSSLYEVSRLAVCASALGLGSTIWYCTASGLQTLETAALIGLFAAPQGLPLVVTVIVWRIAVGEGRCWYSALTFAFVAAAVDFVFGSLWSHGTWASWANSQAEVLSVIQLASLGGTPAIVFLVTLPASMAAIVLTHGRHVHLPVFAYGLPAALVATALGYGAARLASATVIPRLPIGLAAADSTDFLLANAGSPEDQTLATYLRAATALTAMSAAIVVLPEKVEIVEQAAAEVLRDRLSTWAREHRTHLLVGVAIIAADYRENRAWLFQNDGRLSVDYAKRHLIPLSEGRFRPGNRDAVIMLEGRTLGITFCKDMDFPRLARRYGRAGVQAVLTPAWNLGIDGRYHSRMAVLRGVEQGFSVIRAARQGMLTVSDPFGRIVAEAASAETPVATLFAEAPLGGFGTTYGRIGDVFGWACVAIVGLLLWRSRG